MTEVSTLRAFFNLSLHAPSRGAAHVSGTPCHPPESSSDCSCSCSGLQHVSSGPLPLTASHLSWAPSFS